MGPAFKPYGAACVIADNEDVLQPLKSVESTHSRVQTNIL